MNRLSHEKSPYLLQHANNPVDWMPWGDEAFARAKAEDKPLLISIGYSTCHWCHVMERECFEDPAIAQLMNRWLVCVKVDREERPDIDKVYMTAVQALTGQGGWPLNCFATPEGQPFTGGTYFPPVPRYNRPSWPQIVEGIGRAWKDGGKRLDIVKHAQSLTDALKANQEAGVVASEPLDARYFDQALAVFRRSYDADLGGFSPAPKFPMPANHDLVLRLSRRFAREGRTAEASEAAHMSLETLRAMAKGGIYDQLGGGFSRYSTDERWHVPHFEKMLYDNAQLAVNYTEAFQLSGDAFFARIARETLDYCLRDLGHPDGGFYSAEDADSLPPSEGAHEKVEGAFYAWDAAEIGRLLGPDAAARFFNAYGCKPDGNVLQDPSGEFRGKNVLFAVSEVDEPGLAASRKLLFDARAKRPRPHRDEKILSSWNGLLLSALAKAGVTLDEPRFLKAAQRLASFLKSQLWDGKTLYRRLADGERAIPGHSDDYAFVAQGLLDLHQASFAPADLAWATELSQAAKSLFFDPADGLVFMTRAGADPFVMSRSKESHDNVEPAAASVMALNHLRLWMLTGEQAWRDAAELTLKAHAALLARSPRDLPKMACALDLSLSAPTHAVIIGETTDAATQAMLKVLRKGFEPSLSLLCLSPADKAAWPSWAKAFAQEGGKPTAYVCRDFACQLPVTDPEKLRGLLG